jgi:predicted pyridoxine 5'-phosphate oxidase superfamily flavin-nucleotide-binding protein
MGKVLDTIEPKIAELIAKQHVFFVATAPLSAEGHVNVSPKGLATFAILGPREVAYLDLTGSGAETIAHLRENGRITLMFCAFEGPPLIVRLHGKGEIVARNDPRFAALAARFPARDDVRAVIRVDVARVSTSCGYSVPVMTFERDRRELDAWAAKKGPEGLVTYRRTKNRRSIDGLDALGEDEAG